MPGFQSTPLGASPWCWHIGSASGFSWWSWQGPSLCRPGCLSWGIPPPARTAASWNLSLPVLCGRKAAISITGTDPLCLHPRLWDSGLPQRLANYVEGTLGAHWHQSLLNCCCCWKETRCMWSQSLGFCMDCAWINLLPIQETSCSSSPLSALNIFLPRVSAALCDSWSHEYLPSWHEYLSSPRPRLTFFRIWTAVSSQGTLFYT